jgi:hypothetical protein
MKLCVLMLLLCIFSVSGQTIGTGEIFRTSELNNEKSPWKLIEVTNISLKRKPSTGTLATIVPLGVNIEAFNLKIARSKMGDPCDESPKSAFWEIEFAPITQQMIFEIEPLPNRRAEMPFDVAVIYPAVGTAKQMPTKNLTISMLPKNVNIKTIKAVIDTTGDSLPDIIITEYCCDKPSTNVECDYTCGRTYLKSSGSWKLIDTSTPC